MIDIGTNIRQLRKRRKESIQELSEETGLSVSHLSKIERGLVSPSLDALEKIAVAFQVPVTTLFSAPSTKSPVTRKDERVQIVLPSRLVESLCNNTDSNSFGAYYCIEGEGINGHQTNARGEQNLGLFSHNGEELIHVLEGEMRFTLGLEEYILKEGDSIFFDANIEHSARRITPQVKMLIITNPSTPVTGFSRG